MRILGCATVLAFVTLANVGETQFTAVGLDTLGESAAISTLPVDVGNGRSSDVADDLNVGSLLRVDNLWGSTGRGLARLIWGGEKGDLRVLSCH